MKKMLGRALMPTLVFALCTSLAFAQRDKAEEFETELGPLTVQPISHATLVLTWNEKTIYVDPTGGAATFEGLEKPDLVLITDVHGDHLNLETLQALGVNNEIVVGPRDGEDKLDEAQYGLPNYEALTNDDAFEWEGITITAIPMYNLPEYDDESYHPKGRGNGYVLEMGGKTLYISGGTEDVHEMRRLEGIDIAFISINQPYTMDIYQATSAVLEFQPKVVFPYHYRGKDGKSDVKLFRKLVTDANKEIEVVLKDWYPND